MHANDLAAMSAKVFLIVASWDAERNEAAAEPATDKAKNETENPGESSLVLSNACHAGVLTELASDRHGVVRPVASGIGTSDVRNNDMSLWLHHHLGLLLHAGLHLLLHGLLIHHGLTLSWCGHTRLHDGLSHARLRHWLLGSVLHLGLALRGIHGSCHRCLTTHEGLLVGCDLAIGGVADLRFFRVHA